MSQINVRNLDEWIVDAFRERAKLHGCSLEAELRQVLRDEALRSRRRIASELKQLREQVHEQLGAMADTTEILRQIRDTE